MANYGRARGKLALVDRLLNIVKGFENSKKQAI